MDVERDMPARPQYRKTIACIAFRYGQGGSGEELCRRVAHDLALRFSVRILSLGKTESSRPGIFFDSGIPVRSFSLDHAGESTEIDDREPTSRELDAYLQSEKERYAQYLFLGTQASLVTGALLNYPERTMYIPLEDAPQPPNHFNKIIYDGDEPETRRSVDRYISLLKRRTPALFLCHSPRELESAPERVQWMFIDFRNRIKNLQGRENHATCN